MEGTDVANMDDFFGRQLSEEEYRRITDEQAARGQGDLIAMTGMGEMQPNGMIGGDTLDDIVRENQREILRRRSMQQPYGRSSGRENGEGSRSASMMEFGGPGNDGNLTGYQFVGSPVQENASLPHSQGQPPTSVPHHSHVRRPSARDLALDTQFTNLGPGFNSMGNAHAFSAALHSADALTMSAPGPYTSSGLSAGLTNSMSLDYPSAGMDHVSSGEVTPMNHFSQSNLQPELVEQHYSPVNPDFTGHLHDRKDPGGGHVPPGNPFAKVPEPELKRQTSSPLLNNQTSHLHHSPTINSMGPPPDVPMRMGGQSASRVNGATQPQANTSPPIEHLEKPRAPPVEARSSIMGQ